MAMFVDFGIIKPTKNIFLHYTDENRNIGHNLKKAFTYELQLLVSQFCMEK